MGKKRRESEGEDVRIINWFYELKKQKSLNRHTRRDRGVLLSGFVSFFYFLFYGELSYSYYSTLNFRAYSIFLLLYYSTCGSIRSSSGKNKKEARGRDSFAGNFEKYIIILWETAGCGSKKILTGGGGLL